MRGSSASSRTLTVTNQAQRLVDIKVNRVSCIVYNTTGTVYIKYVTPDSPQPASDALFTYALGPDSDAILADFTGEMSIVKKGTGSTTVMVTEVW